MGILIAFGTAALLSLFFSPRIKGAVAPAALFFSFMFLSAATWLFLIGPLKAEVWGLIWLPLLLIAKKFYVAKNEKSAKKRKTKIEPQLKVRQ